MIKKLTLISIVILSFCLIVALTVLHLNRYGENFNKVIPLKVTLKHEKMKTIKAVERALYESDGTYIQLKGINFGNWLIQEGWMTPNSLGAKYNDDGSFLKVNEEGIVEEYEQVFQDELEEALRKNPNLNSEKIEKLWDAYYKSYCTEEDFKNIKEIGFNMIRLPMYYRTFMEGDDNKLRMKEEPYKLVDWFLEMAKKYDLYVILDMHGVVGGQSSYEHSGTRKTEFWNNEYYQEQMCLLWKNIALHYINDRPDLAETIAAYDLVNEPTLDGATTGKKQWRVLDKMYEAIREVDKDHVISIEGCWRFTNLPNPKKYGWENVLYQYHIYNWNQATFSNDIYFLSHWLTYRFANYNVPKYIGEFTFFDNNEEWQKYLHEFDLRGFNWSIWSYKTVSVGWWDSTWGLYVDRMNLKDNKLKLDVRTATYEEIYDVWSNQETSKTYNETGKLKEILDEYFSKTKKAV